MAANREMPFVIKHSDDAYLTNKATRKRPPNLPALQVRGHTPSKPDQEPSSSRPAEQKSINYLISRLSIDGTGSRPTPISASFPLISSKVKGFEMTARCFCLNLPDSWVSGWPEAIRMGRSG